MHQYDTLVVSSDRATTNGLRRLLDASGISSQTADSIGQAAELLHRGHLPRLMILDCYLEDGNVLDFLARHGRRLSSSTVLVVAAQDALDVAQEALRMGAKGVLSSPLDPAALERAVAAALVHPESLGADEQLAAASWSPFLGSSCAIQALARDVARVARTDVAVLIQGETGTGKGVLARCMHGLGPRASGPFIDVNCAALSKELFESEMCGFERGAFTGATAQKPGLMEAANSGTMFLDEIGDLDPGVQPRLLKLIEEKRFRRLGSVREQRTDARFIAASNQDLNVLVRDRSFRADLLFRLNTVTLVCPSLRDRADDIPVLAQRVLLSVGQQLRRPGLTLSPGALDALRAHVWPGNIRELQHVIERAALMSEGTVIDVGDLRIGVDRTGGDGNSPGPEGGTLETLQVGHIQTALDAENWNVERAARRLDIPRSTLYQKIKRYRLVCRGGAN